MTCNGISILFTIFQNSDTNTNSPVHKQKKKSFFSGAKVPTATKLKEAGGGLRPGTDLIITNFLGGFPE